MGNTFFEKEKTSPWERQMNIIQGGPMEVNCERWDGGEGGGGGGGGGLWHCSYLIFSRFIFTFGNYFTLGKIVLCIYAFEEKLIFPATIILWKKSF